MGLIKVEKVGCRSKSRNRRGEGELGRILGGRLKRYIR